MADSKKDWRIYNVDGAPVTQPCESEAAAWKAYAESVGLTLREAKKFRNRQEARGWRALETDYGKTRTERYLEVKRIILKRCGVCDHSADLLQELLGIIELDDSK